MTTATKSQLTLEEFLKLPETNPASEFIDGEIIQKPMPQGRHSKLQLRLCNSVNNVTEEQKIALALPELRCTFGGRSVVPDVAVFSWHRIPRNPNREIADAFECHPDWVVEILSPEQSSIKVIKNILHCLNHGCRLGWLIDPDERSILVFLPSQQPEVLQESDRLPVLAEIPLNLTVEQVFNWLKLE